MPETGEQSPNNGAESSISTLFLDFSRRKLIEEWWPRLRGRVESLTEEQIWWRPNEASNSVGNLIVHLNGNIRQWLISSFNSSQDLPVHTTSMKSQADPI